MANVALTAILTPAPGKATRFLELFEECVDYVAKNEPYVLRYELHKNKAKEQFIVYELYQDQAGMDKHMVAEPVTSLIATIEKEKLMTASEIIMHTPGPGIPARL